MLKKDQVVVLAAHSTPQEALTALVDTYTHLMTLINNRTEGLLDISGGVTKAVKKPIAACVPRKQVFYFCCWLEGMHEHSGGFFKNA